MKELFLFGLLFDEEEVEKIVEEQSIHSSSDLLFSTKDGHLIEHSSINAIFKRICREAGICLYLPKGCHVHMIKHTAVTRLIELGMDINAISKVVGTSVKILTKTYAHILDDFVAREIEKTKQTRKENNLSLSKTKTESNCKIISFASYR